MECLVFLLSSSKCFVKLSSWKIQLTIKRIINIRIRHNVIINCIEVCDGSFMEIKGRKYFSKEILNKMLFVILKVWPRKNTRIWDIERKLRIAIGKYSIKRNKEINILECGVFLEEISKYEKYLPIIVIYVILII